jgi:hypothetical protein
MQGGLLVSQESPIPRLFDWILLVQHKLALWPLRISYFWGSAHMASSVHFQQAALQHTFLSALGSPNLQVGSAEGNMMGAPSIEDGLKLRFTFSKA